MWAQAAGYAQPGFTFENVPLDDLDATLTWGQSSTTPGEIFDFQNNSVSILPSSLGRGRTYFVIEYQLDVRRDRGRRDDEPRYPPPECHRGRCICANHHTTLLQQQHGRIHSRVLPPHRKHATTHCHVIQLLILSRCRTFPLLAPHVSCRLSVYVFVLTEFKALTNASSLPSPQSDGSVNGFLGFANPEVAPSSFVSVGALT
jgi:hypothetical protein